MNTIECRSPQEIFDDMVVQIHTRLTKELNMVVPGVGLLYTGRRREVRKQFLADLDKVISGELVLCDNTVYLRDLAILVTR